MQMVINRHFDLTHGVKIEVKQVDDNYTWLYNENQYLYVELSVFLQLWINVVGLSSAFCDFQLKGVLVTRQLVPKSIVSHSFGSIDIRVPPYTPFLGIFTLSWLLPG